MWFDSTALRTLVGWQSWFNAPDLKSGGRDERPVGSNPTPTAMGSAAGAQASTT